MVTTAAVAVSTFKAEDRIYTESRLTPALTRLIEASEDVLRTDTGLYARSDLAEIHYAERSATAHTCSSAST